MSAAGTPSTYRKSIVPRSASLSSTGAISCVPFTDELLGTCTTSGRGRSSTRADGDHRAASTTTGHHVASGTSSRRSGVETKTGTDRDASPSMFFRATSSSVAVAAESSWKGDQG